MPQTRQDSDNISKLPIAKPCEKPWFFAQTLLNFAKLFAKPCLMLQNNAKPGQYLRKCATTCESLLNHICENLQNLSISAKAYLQILAKVHAFWTCKSLLKHYLQKRNCKTLQTVYSPPAQAGPTATPTSPKSAWSSLTFSGSWSSQSQNST